MTELIRFEDSKEVLDEEHPDLHDEYIKMSPVKSSIRVKVREEK